MNNNKKMANNNIAHNNMANNNMANNVNGGHYSTKAEPADPELVKGLQSLVNDSSFDILFGGLRMFQESSKKETEYSGPTAVSQFSFVDLNTFTFPQTNNKKNSK